VPDGRPRRCCIGNGDDDDDGLAAEEIERSVQAGGASLATGVSRYKNASWL
jgi:hypothetical protein